MTKTLFYILLIVSVLTGCVGSQSAEMEPEVLAFAKEHGDRLSNEAQKRLGGRLKQAMAAGGPEHAIQFCQVAAFPILDSIQTDIPAQIKRASLRWRNPSDQPTKPERKILNRYNAMLEKGQELEPVVEVLGKEEVLYAKPILLNNPICLNCHGQSRTEVSSEVLVVLKSLYPEDNALNHKMGDLRGIWSITYRSEDLMAYLKKL